MIACETALAVVGLRHATVPQKDVICVRHARTAGDLKALMQVSYVAWEGRVLDPSCPLNSLTCGGAVVPLRYGSTRAEEHYCPIRFKLLFKSTADLVVWFAVPYFAPINHVLKDVLGHLGPPYDSCQSVAIFAGQKLGALDTLSTLSISKGSSIVVMASNSFCLMSQRFLRGERAKVYAELPPVARRCVVSILLVLKSCPREIRNMIVYMWIAALTWNFFGRDITLGTPELDGAVFDMTDAFKVKQCAPAGSRIRTHV